MGTYRIEWRPHDCDIICVFSGFVIQEAVEIRQVGISLEAAELALAYDVDITVRSSMYRNLANVEIGRLRVLKRRCRL